MTRAERVRRAVEDGLARWHRDAGADITAEEPPNLDSAPGGGPASPAAVRESAPRDGVRMSLPRRPPLHRGSDFVAPPMRSQVVLRASFFAALSRLVGWLRAVGIFGLGEIVDRLLRRATSERRAVRLRRILERISGTFLKLGQQMSIRIDLLPMVYCMELSKLLDRVPPFPTEQAVEIIERSTGRRLEDLFEAFDPEPIGSASVACVYQAVLKTGEKVAVKVRRPNIVRTFAADWRALSWLTSIAELLTLVRPGQLPALLRDLEAMFLEELDFRREARNTDLFRRRADDSRLRFISAPRVWFEHSSTEVLVTGFVSGIWLWELLAVVESDDRKAMAQLRSLDIDPVRVARRLFKASLFGIFENLVFHADPHPANVVVRPGSEIVLIDFGSCGSYTDYQLNIVRQFHYCQANEDIGGMVQCSLSLLEPLPPVDVDEMTRDVEQIFTDSIHALRSGNSEWWERTSAGVWIGFMKVARKYHIRVNLDTLRMIRSTLLYDTLAARLWPELDIYREYGSYRKQMGKAARQRFDRKVRRFFTRGLDDRLFLRWEELIDLGNRVTYRLHRYLDSPSYKFSFLAGKAVYAITTFVRWMTLSLLAGAVGVAGLALRHVGQGIALSFSEIVQEVASNNFYLAIVLGFLVLSIRRVLLRFSDKDV